MSDVKNQMQELYKSIFHWTQTKGSIYVQELNNSLMSRGMSDFTLAADLFPCIFTGSLDLNKIVVIGLNPRLDDKSHEEQGLNKGEGLNEEKSLKWFHHCCNFYSAEKKGKAT